MPLQRFISDQGVQLYEIIYSIRKQLKDPSLNTVIIVSFEELGTFLLV